MKIIFSKFYSAYQLIFKKKLQQRINLYFYRKIIIHPSSQQHSKA